MKLIKSAFIGLILGICLWLIIDCFRYPECYLTTWKYQLKNDLARGDKVAIEYYESRYIANGRTLFD